MSDTTVGERVAKSLGDYVQVKDRIAKFYELFGGGRLVTDRVEIWQDDGVPRIVVKALAYRTVDDPHPGVGWSWMELPGRTPYTKGSEVENAETSAWGRAIGSLGILIDASIATQNEIDNKADDQRPLGQHSGPPNRPVLTRTTGEQGLIGKVATSGSSDYNLRQTPDDGWRLPFRVKEGNRVGQIVIAEGDMALALEPMRDQIMGTLVTVWGTYEDAESPPKADGYVVVTKLLHLTRIKGADWELPLPEPPPDVPLVGEHPEAETAPLGLT